MKFIVKKKLVLEYTIYENVYADTKSEAWKKAEELYDVMDIEDCWQKPSGIHCRVAYVKQRGKQDDR